MILSAGTLASCMLRTKLFLQRWTFASHSVRLPSLSSSQPSSSSSQPSSSRPNRSGQLCGAGHWLHQLRAHLHLPGDRPLHHNGKSDILWAGFDWNLSRATAGLAQCCKGLWRRMRRWVLLTITIIIINITIIITIIITITIITIHHHHHNHLNCPDHQQADRAAWLPSPWQQPWLWPNQTGERRWRWLWWCWWWLWRLYLVMILIMASTYNEHDHEDVGCFGDDDDGEKILFSALIIFIIITNLSITKIIII